MHEKYFCYMDFGMTPIDPILRANIMSLAKAFAKGRGIKLATVSRLVRGDPYFLQDLSSGKCGVTSWKYDEVVTYFEKHWPLGTVMPKIREFENADN